jgi:uncharacterized membrane protein YeiH
MHTLILALDLCGTFVFALSGAALGVRKRVDLFGVLVLALAAATSGGIARDVMLGDAPPAAIDDWRYLAVSLLAGLIVFQWGAALQPVRSSVLILDAAGLSLFAVSGATKALEFGTGPGAAILFGVLTGIGGGMVRDLLVTETPTVMRSELYAIAALAGACVVVLGDALDISPTAASIAGAGVCFVLRIMAIHRNWRLPRPHPTGAPSAEE